MRGLSFRQPWAHIVVHEGKRNENRTWHTNVRGPFLVHASKTMTHKEYDKSVWYVREHIEDGLTVVKGLPHPDKLLKGGIVGVADLVGCRRSPTDIRECEEYEIPGGYVFELGDVAPLPFVECRGALGFWDVPFDVLSRTKLPQLFNHSRSSWEAIRGWREHPLRDLVPDVVNMRQPEPEHLDKMEAQLTDFGRKIRDAMQCGGR